MKHDTKVDYPGGFDKLAEDLGNLRYDALAEFLNKLSDKLGKDAEADGGRERFQLSTQLIYAAKHVKNAWKICEPFMRVS